jgi:demethylmenaquinone methyltransferase/2-methoxy-6-polyprenyl-1,4-benzoquinol methylase
MSAQVEQMFTAIAPTYDRVNTVLSFGAHHFWRQKAVRLSGAKAGHRVLDCATGTGDLAMAMKRAVGDGGHVTGIDFSPGMLEHAPQKATDAGLDIAFQQADVLALPFPDDAFDIASIAFGIRNVDDPVAGLRDMARVVKPGGKVVVLEFGQPDGLFFGPLYRFYSSTVMPLVGGAISGNFKAYRYLPETAAQFPAGDSFLALMTEAGSFAGARAHSLWGGIAFTYVGEVG